MPGLSGSNLAGTSHERGGTLGRRRLPIRRILLFRALFGDDAICLCDTKAKVSAGSQLKRAPAEADAPLAEKTGKASALS
jgi:hypothetical protein